MFFKRKGPKHYIAEAEALFARFAEKHNLAYVVEDAPVEVLWKFPTQAGLTRHIVLCLQNNDELSFGVGDFWTYLFPFPDKAAFFEHMIDAWAEGKARVVPRPGLLWQVLEVQVYENGAWETIYRAGSLSFRKTDSKILMNARDL